MSHSCEEYPVELRQFTYKEPEFISENWVEFTLPGRSIQTPHGDRADRNWRSVLLRPGVWLLVAPLIGFEQDRRGRLVEDSLELQVRGFLYYQTSVLADIVFRAVERSHWDPNLGVVSCLDSYTWLDEVTTRDILQEEADKLRGKERCYDRDFRSIVVSLRLAREGFLPHLEEALRLPVPIFVLEGFLGGLDLLIWIHWAFLEIQGLLRYSDERHTYYALWKEGPRFGEAALELVELIKAASPRTSWEAPTQEQPTEFWSTLDRAIREPPNYLAGITELYGAEGYDLSVRERSLIEFFELGSHYRRIGALKDEEEQEEDDEAEWEVPRDEPELWEDPRKFPEERRGNGWEAIVEFARRIKGWEAIVEFAQRIKGGEPMAVALLRPGLRVKLKAMPGAVTEEEEVNRVSFTGRVTSIIRIRSARSLDERSCKMDAEGAYLTSIGGDVKTQVSRTNSPDRKMGIDVASDAEKLRKALRELESRSRELEGRSSNSEGWRKEVLNRARVATFTDAGIREPYRETPSEPYRRNPYSMAYVSGSYVSPFLGAPTYQWPALSGIQMIFTGKNVFEFLDDWEVLGMRAEWSDQEMIVNFLHHTAPKIDREVRDAIPDNGRWLTFRERVTRIFACDEVSYSVEDLKEMKKEEEESLVAFARRYKKASNPLVEGGFMGEIERCGIFLGFLSQEKREKILRDLPLKVTFSQVKVLAHDTKGIIELDDRKYVMWVDEGKHVPFLPSMKINVDIWRRRMNEAKGKQAKEPTTVKVSRVTFENDFDEPPESPGMRISSIKFEETVSDGEVYVCTQGVGESSRGKREDQDQPMTNERVESPKSPKSPRKRGAKKFQLKSSLDEVDLRESLRRAMDMPIPITLKEFIAGCGPTRDELIGMMKKAKVPLAETATSEGSAGRSVYSVCNLFSGYDEIPLDYRDRQLTAMHTPLGLIQMMVVPMGWTNGVAVFQRVMVAVLGELIPNLVEVFLDDFPIKGSYEKDETGVRPGVRRSYEDVYSDPGSPMTRRMPIGTYVLAKIMLPDGAERLLLNGNGATPDGYIPFLDLLNVETGEKERIWQSNKELHYESVVALMSDNEETLHLDRLKILFSRESQREPPQYFLKKWSDQEIVQITNFPHPYPELKDLSKEIIRYQRNDGVQLTATLYLPPGYDPKAEGPLTMLMWAYPREFKSKDAAGQVRGSPNQFAGIGGTSPLLWLAKRYAILDGPTMPIVAEGDDEPNDRSGFIAIWYRSYTSDNVTDYDDDFEVVTSTTEKLTWTRVEQRTSGADVALTVEDRLKKSITVVEVVAAGIEASKLIAQRRQALDQFALKQLEDIMEAIRKEVGEQTDMSQTLSHIVTYLTFLEEKIVRQQTQLDEIVVGLRTIANIVKGKNQIQGEEKQEEKEDKKEVRKLMGDAMKSAGPTIQTTSNGNEPPSQPSSPSRSSHSTPSHKSSPSTTPVKTSAEPEKPKKKEKVKTKLPSTFCNKKEESLLLWIAEIQTYVRTAPVEPESQVAFTTSCMGGEAKQWVLADANAAGFEDIGEWAKTLTLKQFLAKTKDRFLDKTTTDKAFDQLTSIGQKHWTSVEALSREVDRLLQVPRLNLQDSQVLYIYSRALPEPIRGHLVTEAKSGKYNYRQFRDLALQREQPTSQVKSSYATVVKSGGGGGGRPYNGKRILWRQKRQDHTLVVFDDGTVEKWPLEDNDNNSDSGKGEVTAVVANKGGPPRSGSGKKPRPFPWHPGIADGKPWLKMGMTRETWQERMDNAQCLKCGTPGHVIAYCPMIRESISMDFMSLTKSRNGNSQVMVIVDRFSKYAMFIPLPAEARTELVIQKFQMRWVTEYGFPLSIVSDRNARFTSMPWQKLMEAYGTLLTMSSGRHPETNGQSEQMNRLCQQLLRMYVRPDQIDWDENLPKIASAYNSSVHTATGRTPNALHKGWKPKRPVDVLTRDQFRRLPPGTREYAVLFQEDIKKVKDNLKKAQDRMIEQAKKHRRPSTFKEGDLVWVKSKEFSLEENVSQKLLLVYFGPWEVLKVIGDAEGPSYIIDIPPHLKTYLVFHASKLLPYVEGNEFPHRPSMIPPDMDGGYEVDRIIEHGYFSTGARGRPQKQFKITPDEGFPGGWWNEVIERFPWLEQCPWPSKPAQALITCMKPESMEVIKLVWDSGAFPNFFEMIGFSDLARMAMAWDSNRASFRGEVEKLGTELEARKEEYARECAQLTKSAARAEQILLKAWGLSDAHLRNLLPATPPPHPPRAPQGPAPLPHAACQALDINDVEMVEMEQAIAAISATMQQTPLRRIAAPRPLAYTAQLKYCDSARDVAQGDQAATILDLRNLRKVRSVGRPYLKCSCKRSDEDRDCPGGPLWVDHAIWHLLAHPDVLFPSMSSTKVRTSMLVHYLRTTWKDAIIGCIIFMFIREIMVDFVKSLETSDQLNAEEVIKDERMWRHQLPSAIGRILLPTRIPAIPRRVTPAVRQRAPREQIQGQARINFSPANRNANNGEAPAVARQRAALINERNMAAAQAQLRQRQDQQAGGTPPQEHQQQDLGEEGRRRQARNDRLQQQFIEEERVEHQQAGGGAALEHVMQQLPTAALQGDSQLTTAQQGGSGFSTPVAARPGQAHIPPRNGKRRSPDDIGRRLGSLAIWEETQTEALKRQQRSSRLAMKNQQRASDPRYGETAGGGRMVVLPTGRRVWSKEKRTDLTFLHMKYTSWAMEAFSVRSLVTGVLRRLAGDEAGGWLEGVVFGWTYEKLVAAHVCGPKEVFKDFDIEHWTDHYDPAQCHCRAERYMQFHSEKTLELLPGAEHTHVLTLDAGITSDCRLRAMIKVGLNHIPLRAFDVDEALFELGGLLDRLIMTSHDIANLREHQRRKFKQIVLDRAKSKMNGYISRHRFISAEPIDQTSTRREIEFLTQRFLVSPTDKSANTPSFVCTNFIHVLALRRLLGPDFVMQQEDPEQLISVIKGSLIHLPALPSSHDTLPYLMTVYKAHKQSFRWITNTANTVVSPMADLCACLLRFLIPSVQSFCSEKSRAMEAEYDVRPNLWWPISSVGEFAANLPQSVYAVYTTDIMRCFETIPTDDSEHSLLTAVRFFVQTAMIYRRDRSSRDIIKVRVTAQGKMIPSWTDARLENTTEELFFTEAEVSDISWCLDHSLVQVGACVWKQVLGIPMGVACSPIWCDIYFFKYEYHAMMRLLTSDNKHLVPQFDNTYRYVDDLCSLNNNSIHDFFRADCDQTTDPIWIYPREFIEMKETTEVRDEENQGIVANFLNMTLSVSSTHLGHFSTMKHDEKKGLNFSPTRFMEFNSNRSIAQSLQIITVQVVLRAVVGAHLRVSVVGQSLMLNHSRGPELAPPLTARSKKRVAALLRERKEKMEKRELIKQVKMLVLLEEQEAKKKHMEEEMERWKEQEEKMAAIEAEVEKEVEVKAEEPFVEQLVASAQAAVDEVVRRGVAHPKRIVIGGHSYGAFMSANLLARAPDLFCCGIARSGAYNRTLTPFGFQSEERTLWEAPNTYHEMSPFMLANKVHKPLLLIHGEDDNNSGTFPMQSERFYSALKGHGAVSRLVLLPHESHGYRARESTMHTLWEMERWMQRYADFVAVENKKENENDTENITKDESTSTAAGEKPVAAAGVREESGEKEQSENKEEHFAETSTGHIAGSNGSTNCSRKPWSSL
ncbi:hypothetical protein CBR_g25720 [Chara braunii]|uniref:Integrase catalytic domain-containing protein n=1 Tax=Chara braunii TaxID=69332 RepID=A0A388L659_CHABU|nr:hypothetical protein CBR_g25720 [Chara braunii]|eukprot:GBG77789.1 hypothetical protein CBR_g25720 [Chara braunii]